MTIYDIVRKMQMLLNDGSALSTIDTANLTSKLITDFEENFKIVPKEEFGVIYNTGGYGRIVTGGFHSEKEAERFRDEWYKKQDAYIEEILAKNPDADVECDTYLTVGKIDPIKKEYLEWFKFDHELKAQADLTELLLSGE